MSKVKYDEYSFEEYVRKNLLVCIWHYHVYYANFKKRFWWKHLFFKPNKESFHKHDSRAKRINRVYKDLFGCDIKVP